jgi:hypothetical protein
MTRQIKKVEMTQAFFQYAISLLGQDRVDELRSSLEERAEHVWKVFQSSVDSEEDFTIIFPEEGGTNVTTP